jgi:hypothetical protein
MSTPTRPRQRQLRSSRPKTPAPAKPTAIRNTGTYTRETLASFLPPELLPPDQPPIINHSPRRSP